MVLALQNGQLEREFRLDRFEAEMEVPLDREVVAQLRGLAKKGKKILPPFKSIKKLTPEVSKQYQDFAKVVAGDKVVSRGRLDLVLWRQDDTAPAPGTK